MYRAPPAKETEASLVNKWGRRVTPCLWKKGEEREERRADTERRATPCHLKKGEDGNSMPLDEGRGLPPYAFSGRGGLPPQCL